MIFMPFGGLERGRNGFARFSRQPDGDGCKRADHGEWLRFLAGEWQRVPDDVRHGQLASSFINVLNSGTAARALRSGVSVALINLALPFDFRSRSFPHGRPPGAAVHISGRRVFFPHHFPIKSEMPMNIRSVVGLFTLSFLGMNLARGIDNPIVEGPARFTVITPERIRIEYAPGGKFVAARSLFAVERTARWDALHAPAGGWRESFRNPRTTTSACPIPPTSGILTVAVGWSRMQEKTSCRS